MFQACFLNGLHSKLRSWLTITGIVIGVAAVIAIVSAGFERGGGMFSMRGPEFSVVYLLHIPMIIFAFAFYWNSAFQTEVLRPIIEKKISKDYIRFITIHLLLPPLHK